MPRWSAENGGASGRLDQRRDKSGANSVHGDAFLFAQSGRFNARPSWKIHTVNRLALASLDRGWLGEQRHVVERVGVKPRGKLDVVVEAFNVLNRTNVIQVNTVYGPFLTPLGSFGRPIDASQARQLQLSVDLEF